MSTPCSYKVTAACPLGSAGPRTSAAGALPASSTAASSRALLSDAQAGWSDCAKALISLFGLTPSRRGRRGAVPYQAAPNCSHASQRVLETSPTPENLTCEHKKKRGAAEGVSADSLKRCIVHRHRHDGQTHCAQASKTGMACLQRLRHCSAVAMAAARAAKRLWHSLACLTH